MNWCDDCVFQEEAVLCIITSSRSVQEQLLAVLPHALDSLTHRTPTSCPNWILTEPWEQEFPGGYTVKDRLFMYSGRMLDVKLPQRQWVTNCAQLCAWIWQA